MIMFSSSFQKSVSKIAVAVQESLVDSFVLKPIFALGEQCSHLRSRRNMKNILIYGRMKAVNRDFIFLEINDRDYAQFLREICRNHSFDIYFQLNLMTFQLQHNALDWMVRHRLFDRLVDNPNYNDVGTIGYAMAHTTMGTSYEFR